MKTGIVGRADLLEAFAAGGPELQATLARLLGMERVIPEPIVVPPEIRPASAIPTSEAPPSSVAVTPIPFWYAKTYTRIEPLLAESEVERVEVAAPGERSSDRPPPAPLVFRPLATPAAILTKLRRVSTFSRTSRELDVPKVVSNLSRGHVPVSLPRRSRKAWGQSIHVVVDGHEHLKPYFQDQDAVLKTLRRVYPRDGVDVVKLRHGASQPQLGGIRRFTSYQPPEPGSIVLALSDLGALALDRREPHETWLALGKLYRGRGARPIALVPCDVACIPSELTRDWIVIPWEGHAASRIAGLSPDQVNQVSRRILTLLSFALRIEPILIRELRRLLIKGHPGAGVEACVWQDQALRGQSYEAAEFHPDQARQLQSHFENETSDLRQEVVSLLRRCHGTEYEFVWFLERLNLEAETKKLELIDDDLDTAVRWARARGYAFEKDTEKRDPTSDESLWFRRAFVRLTESPLQGSAGDSLHKLWAMTRASKDLPPICLDPTRVPPLGHSLRTVEIRHSEDGLVARPVEVDRGVTRPAGSLLGLIQTRNGLLKLDEPRDFWEGGNPPRWADDWGWDSFGAWVTLRVGDASLRLRWIPAGEFWMGSPEEEEGRDSDEGPRHKEIIAKGFWMFDTPCTQALWEAVMGENPSRFKGHDRPVETVNWDQCQEFLKRLNERGEGLELRLPSEAQWEYACRAGTTTATYAGPMEIQGRNNAPVLDAIAWYGGNSGIDFELSDGEDASGWPEKQYEFAKAGTHPVGRKQQNPWGLYDTLGNVYEWCEDVWRNDYNTKTNAAEASVHRVIRGGSWRYIAQGVRAAYRGHYEPTSRDRHLGFRCAEFRAPGPAGRQEGAEPPGSRGGVGAEHPGDRDPVSGAGWINIDAEERSAVEFSTLAPVRVSSDVEQIVLRTMSRPDWASNLGRDRYGLWAEFTIEGMVAKPPTKRTRKKKKIDVPEVLSGPVRQRLRWIPPGRFLMGSAPDEPGRLDWEELPHEVAIEEGFWMFETPCTQALWEALMPENPSRFKSRERPVENVSWEDCGPFVSEINKRIGLTLALPSEAQWEYACRAGTTTATYAGPMEIQGKNNAPVLDAIAWYGGNSGIDFELSDGEDASGWPEKQYEFAKAGTHPVGRKQQNPWGLFDMLGNVWQWCEDLWETGKSGTSSASVRRVVRGGSWGSSAQDVRAAFRVHDVPTFRSGSLGFRCAEFRAGRELSGGSQDRAAEWVRSTP
jgi:formylglycine-generating enzyme required for sulfatase activity